MSRERALGSTFYVSYSASTLVNARLSGGADGEEAHLRCRVTTSGGRVADMTGIIKVNSA